MQTETGLKPIESIQAGMLVYASDPETGETALREVVQTFVNETDELVHVSLSNGEEIVTTPTHPFYTPTHDWTAAIDLRACDILVTVNGEQVIVEQVEHELLESPVTVYNFEVEGLHTYFVGSTGVLVHNSCSGGFKKANPSQIESQNNLKPGTFHRQIKPKILAAEKPPYTVGRNPDILLNRALDIAYQGAKGSGFHVTKLNLRSMINTLK